ncbi:MAG: RnfH family protein [Gammaproteobacteria bacterium]|nr:RnfH family protein [Gammaproteobacteria bacterium]
MGQTENLQIEVAFARPERQWLTSLEVPAGTTAREAVQRSDLAGEITGFDISVAPLGVFGKAVADDYVLAAGDRVEVYRALIRNPKEARRLRAERGSTG